MIPQNLTLIRIIPTSVSFALYIMSTPREARKSVAFSEGATVVDANGGVTEINGTSEKTSAESHTAGRLSKCPKFSPMLTY